MDGIVRIKVSGNHISKDSKLAGVRGEGNSTNLKITFDEGWDEYAKTVTFFDARGANPVERTLTTDLIDNIEGDERTYTVPVPPESLTEAGNMTFIVDGYTGGEYVDGKYVGGKRKRSVSDTLEVKDSPNSRVTIDPTPTQAEQLQAEIEKIKGDIQNAAISAKSAEKDADRAEATVGKAAYIGDNGNWYAWDGVEGVFYDTGVKAQAGSTVYYGDNPPEDADIWIKPTDDDNDNTDEVKEQILLKDHATNDTYTLYVLNGELRIKEGEV